ncbi:MAG: hypothetical protein CVU62_13890 [Deltaproteobacteria bacterium HGW-Deltaproteobacteria-2]|jgi:hypothetical protein|nr:MAG: hypothetical protein CVU62_13890 [Deltaproteobacteria bacterium HGW-Deltaproteobacteria-2]
MNVENLTKEDVDSIFDNLWSRGHEELIIMGSSVEEAKRKFKSMAGKPWATAFHKAGVCCAVFIMEPVGEMKWRTQFAATEEGFKSIWISLTKFFKKASDFIVNDYTEGKGIIELFTIGENESDWFNTMGFNLIETDGFIDKYEKKGA